MILYLVYVNCSLVYLWSIQFWVQKQGVLLQCITLQRVVETAGFSSVINLCSSILDITSHISL